MLVWLMLAQAQECVHIKAVNDNKSPSILAKLAKQVLMRRVLVAPWPVRAQLGGFDEHTNTHTLLRKLASMSCNEAGASTADCTQTLS